MNDCFRKIINFYFNKNKGRIGNTSLLYIRSLEQYRELRDKIKSFEIFMNKCIDKEIIDDTMAKINADAGQLDEMFNLLIGIETDSLVVDKALSEDGKKNKNSKKIINSQIM